MGVQELAHLAGACAVGAVGQVGRYRHVDALGQHERPELGRQARQAGQHHDVRRRLQAGEHVLLAGEHHALAAQGDAADAGVQVGHSDARRRERVAHAQADAAARAGILVDGGDAVLGERYGPLRAGQRAPLAVGPVRAQAEVPQHHDALRPLGAARRSGRLLLGREPRPLPVGGVSHRTPPPSPCRCAPARPRGAEARCSRTKAATPCCRTRPRAGAGTGASV